jgi:predicted nucleic acid-binding protein
MNPIQAVIDTNVLVAAWRSMNGASYRLIASFIEGDDRWQWNISTAALFEYEEVLTAQTTIFFSIWQWQAEAK